MSLLRKLWRKVGDFMDPPCHHPVTERRPAIIQHLSTDTPTPAWTCRLCGMSHRITAQEFYALFGRMPWEGSRA